MNPTKFGNAYYTQLLNNEWVKREWSGPLQYEDKLTGELMMLPSDMALIWDPKFKVYVEEYAKDKSTFYKDFASAYGRLLELGVKRDNQKL
jgi:catalase (peroxidase I)